MNPTLAEQDASRSVSGNTILNWHDYFGWNQNHLQALPWQDPYQLTEKEKQAISRSIQKFQLGESSEGAHLMKLARDYATRRGDRSFVETIKRFIGEEQRHARDLGRFMQQQGIVWAKKDWTDSLFRRLRKLTDLEIAVIMLLTAELVALVYYKALGKATRSPLLNVLCQQIQKDELAHTHFQVFLLQQIRKNRSILSQRLTNLVHRCFYSLVLLIVWFDHLSVYRVSSYRFSEFWQESQENFIRLVAQSVQTPETLTP
uniref:Ferritin-like domain-containing protein n=1 Tax=Desertifilum tharense IPPAS B-1220 TaxID=1781255 RepID=A0ACD5GYH8_9CYAN